MADFVSHHTSAIMLFFLLVMLTSSTGLTLYKKRHNNQLPPNRTRLIVGIVLAQVVIFAGFCIGVLASHS